jgi:hypothetical protein
MLTTISIAGLHQEYQLWIRELTFFREEIRTFETRLELIMQRNSRQGVLVSVEHFQNQFIRHKEVIDQLRYELVHSERQLALIGFSLSDQGMDQIRTSQHPRLREEMETFRKIYKDLKQEFRRFETEWV